MSFTSVLNESICCWHSLIRVCTVCNSFCINLLCSNLRVVTANFYGVRKVRKIVRCYLSLVMRKLAVCIFENKDTDQL